MTIYERIVAGETLRVKRIHPADGQRVDPFNVSPLYLLGGQYYITPRSDWFKFAQVGGVVIGCCKREKMSQEDMQEWCSGLEVVA